TRDGFRSAGSLCRRLRVRGPAAGSQLSCAPLTELRRRPAPALVLSVDRGYGPGRLVDLGPMKVDRPLAAVTIGIVADGVSAVEVEHDGRKRRAVVSGAPF